MRRADGVVFVRGFMHNVVSSFGGDGADRYWMDVGNRWALWNDSEVAEGGFEVMFEGVESDG